MADLLSMSLDDIIKLKKKSNPNQRGKPKTGGKQPTQRLRNLGARSGIIRKGGPKQQQTRQNQQSPSNRNEPTMLHVSNLHFNVSNDDVRELFSDIGPIKKAVLHYDKSGRSLGTAEVTFRTRAAALRAIEKYHNQLLDGRPMSITMVPSSNSVRSPAKNRMGVKAGSGVYKRPQTKGSSRGGPPPKGRANGARSAKSNFPQKRGQRQPKKEVTAEELDADLEAYSSVARSA